MTSQVKTNASGEIKGFHLPIRHRPLTKGACKVFASFPVDKNQEPVASKV